jgi:hypothetical protein
MLMGIKVYTNYKNYQSHDFVTPEFVTNDHK